MSVDDGKGLKSWKTLKKAKCELLVNALCGLNRRKEKELHCMVGWKVILCNKCVEKKKNWQMMKARFTPGKTSLGCGKWLFPVRSSRSDVAVSN